MIPKTITFHWGGGAMSFLRYMTLFSFRKFNPDWCIKLQKCSLKNSINSWSTVEISDGDYYNGEDYTDVINELSIEIVDEVIEDAHRLNNSMSEIHIKDLSSWKILSKLGGFVCDMDVLFFKSISPIYNQLKDFDAALNCFSGPPSRGYIPVTFMGSCGNNNLFDSMYKRAVENYDEKVYQCLGSDCFNNMNITELENEFAVKIFKFHDAIIYPFVTLNSYGEGVDMIHTKSCIEKIPEESIGMHWYGGSLISKHSNDAIFQDTYKLVNTTISKLVERILDA